MDTLVLANSQPHDEKWLSEVRQTILELLEAGKVTIAALAEKMNISERQFYRRINAYTGHTPNTMIQNIRLERANQLLEQRKYATVKEVAYAVGFQRSDYFSRLFFTRYGKRPVDFL